MNRAFDRDVTEAGALRTKIAQCGEARHQRGVSMLGRQNGSIHRWLCQHLQVPQLLVIWVQEDVRVQVHQIPAAQSCRAA